MPRRSLLSLLVAVLAGCSSTASVPEKTYPVTYEGMNVYREAHECTDPEIVEVCESLDDLAYGVDTSIYYSLQSEEPEDEMVYYSLSEDLRKEAENNPVQFIGSFLQISLLGHNLAETYDDERIDEGLVGIRAGFANGYASEGYGKKDTVSAVPYIFYIQDLNEEKRTISLEDLPIAQKDLPWIRVYNSEQLVYALNYGYIPYCTEEDPAYEILSRCIEILSSVTREDMSEKEIYTSIYQYVVSNVQYDYTTLTDANVQNRNNRSMYLEGAVLDEVAVCDGLCKEIIVLARLMGLEAYHIGARNGNEGHAYIYVNVEDQWYLSCPTRGSMRYPDEDGRYHGYMTMNYCLTDFDTNMEGWQFDSDAYPAIEEELRNTQPCDFWSDTSVTIRGKEYTLHPESEEDALAVLHEASALAETINRPVQIELCGSVDVLKSAYESLKEEGIDVTYLSGGSFNAKRLQTYLFAGGEE